MELFKETFLCRASGAGSLMTEPKKKTDTLSKTTITFLNDWMKEQIYGYRKNISTKQMEKAEKYATKHKWLAPYSTGSHRFSFSNYWLHIFQSTSAGDLKVSKYKGSPVLEFTTAFEKDYFRKK